MKKATLNVPLLIVALALTAMNVMYGQSTANAYYPSLAFFASSSAYVTVSEPHDYDDDDDDDDDDASSQDYEQDVKMLTRLPNPNGVSDAELVRRLHPLLPIPKFRQPRVHDRSPPWAAICAMAKGEDRYIEEWTVYHQSLGFAGIYIFDKSKTNSLADFANQYNEEGNVVQVIHSPRHEILQNTHYDMCIHQLRLLPNPPKWLALIDIDEFFAVAEPYHNIVDYLSIHLKQGAWMVNWWMVGTSNQTNYEPLPVTLRFQHRLKTPHKLTKPIFVLSDVLYARVHYVIPRPTMPDDKESGKVNMNSRRFQKGDFVPPLLQAPGQGAVVQGKDICKLSKYCVATPDMTEIVLFHFKYKSKTEYIHRKCVIGEVLVPKANVVPLQLTAGKANPQGATPNFCGLARKNFMPAGRTFDDRPWQLLQRNAPAYAQQFSASPLFSKSSSLSLSKNEEEEEAEEEDEGR